MGVPFCPDRTNAVPASVSQPQPQQLKVTVSIIICTRNRGNDLRQTLETIGTLDVPADLPTEVLVVDNGSTDHTSEVVRNAKLPVMDLRYVYAPRKGKGNAYNAGMAQAKGGIFLFTDDDVRPPKNWIEQMTAPILRNRAHAVLGAIKMASHLERDWMTPFHRSWFTTDGLLKDGPNLHLIGANMSFARTVLERIPRFDVELGPGGLGFREDSLFTQQLHIGGYSITVAPNSVVEHHFDASRLEFKQLKERMAREGQSLAYVAYHWEHVSDQFVHYKLFRALCSLRKARLKSILRGRCSAAPTEHEMRLIPPP